MTSRSRPRASTITSTMADNMTDLYPAARIYAAAVAGHESRPDGIAVNPRTNTIYSTDAQDTDNATSSIGLLLVLAGCR